VPGLFITKDLGTPELKGLSRPVCVRQVIQPSGVRSRLEAADSLTPFVGYTGGAGHRTFQTLALAA